jgi:D-alanine-D-alanine ligase
MARILILWNQLDDDVYEHYRRDNRRTPDWDPALEVEPWETVEEEIELIVKVLVDGGHDAYHINIRDNFQNLLAAIRSDQPGGPPDCVVNLVEFFRDDPEQEHNVPALFELLNVPYTGNRPLALSLCQKKPQAKALLAACGLSTPRGIVIERGPVPRSLDLRFPVIVKPAHDDASGGIDAGSVVHNRRQLEARVKFLLSEHTMAALVEEYIAGRELHCSILGTEALPLYEMHFKGGVDDQGRTLPNIITYRAKWDPYSRDHYAVESKCPADLEPAVVSRIQSAALRAFHAVGCRDYARVDMRLDPATGEPYILEINPNPDLADSCAFAQCVRASGRTYGQAINEIVHYALERAKVKPKRYLGPTDTLLTEYLARRAASK